MHDKASPTTLTVRDLVSTRLDRFLSHAAGLSRTEAQAAVRAGRVVVDGTVARDPAAKVAEGAALTLDGAPVGLRGPKYVMLHKPAGCVCATRDGRHPTVLDLLPPGARAGLHVVGRLDLDVTGLVLLTDDGDWSHRVSAPRRKCPKTYLADLAQPIADAMLEVLRRGLRLRGEDRDTTPAVVTRLAADRVRITVTEGRYHQVKRMFAAVGNRVTALHRERVGPLELDATLPPGAWRDLTPGEVAGLADCVVGGPPRAE
jgi:16S rRNA pseudouridine516 synthase